MEFDIVFEEDLPRSIRTDSKRLQQVLKNLLSNSFKFTHRGRVELKVVTAHKGWNPDNLALNRAERVVAFSVNDTGIGVPIEKQKIIFEAFQQADGTTSRKYGGTGLGLSISREIANLLGGEITVNSAPNVGSTFTLYLPQVSVIRQKVAPIKGEFNVASAEAATASGSSAAYEQPQHHQEMQTTGYRGPMIETIRQGGRSRANARH